MSYDRIAEKYGVAVRSVAEVAKKYNWVAARETTALKAQEKLNENVSDQIAKFNAEKLKVGKFLISVGVNGVKNKPPKTARESREIIDSGYKIATEAMGLDNPKTQVNIQQNSTYISLTDFITQMQKRKQQGEA